MSSFSGRFLADIFEEVHTVAKLRLEPGAHVERMVGDALSGIALNLLLQIQQTAGDLKLLVDKLLFFLL